MTANDASGASRPRSAREVLIPAPMAPAGRRDAPRSVVREWLGAEVRRLVHELDGVSTPARPLERWRLLAGLGRTDLVLARLVEGHLDAIAILAEAGREPVSGAVYGVWASASGRTGLRLDRSGVAGSLDGTMRFCSGAGLLDRALVIARDADDQVLVLDIDALDGRVAPVPGTWPALGMDASDSLDVAVHDLPVRPADALGPPGWYVERTGLHLGGIGVAAVWLGGAHGLLDATAAALRVVGADDHQRAHIGAVVVALESAAAVLVESSRRLDGCPRDPETGLPQLPDGELARVALGCRSAVEAAVGVALARLPRVAGPVLLARDGEYVHRLADLEVFVRQHHGERDLARLGTAELDDPWARTDPGP